MRASVGLAAVLVVFTVALAIRSGPSAAADELVPVLFPEVGRAHGMVLDSADLPVLFYSHTGDPDEDGYGPEMFDEPRSYLVRCADVACLTARSIREVPIHGGSLHLIDDRPVIMTGSLRYTACDDALCSTFSTIVVPIDLGGGPSLAGVEAVGTAGGFVAAVSRYSDGASTAAFVHCASISCPFPVIRTEPGKISDTALDADGHLAYIIDDRLVRCSDIECTDRPSGVLPGPDGHLAFGATGMPMVALPYETSPDEDWPTEWHGLLMHCDDELCEDELEHGVPIVIGNAESRVFFGVPTSLHLGPYGIPIYGNLGNTGFDNDNRDISSYQSVGRCAVAHCTAPDTLDNFHWGAGPPTFFAATSDDTALLFQGRDDRHYPNRVALRTCNPCSNDVDGDGLPDWADLACGYEAVTIDLGVGQVPTAGDDVIMGTPGDDIIAAGEGNDTVCGGGGDDRIWGQAGDDAIYGGPGIDHIRGGDGDDRLLGGLDADDLAGGRGDDRVFGEDGDDLAVRGGTGDDLVLGGRGDDELVAGNGGRDSVDGGAGNDWVTGGPRPDSLWGGDGDDVLRGNKGADVIYGGSGHDELYGGPGRDHLIGAWSESRLEVESDLCNGGSEVDTVEHCAVLELVP